MSFDLNKSPGHLLRRAQQYSFDQYAKIVGTGNLTPRQFAVLHTVSKNEGLSQTDLVKLTGIDRSTLADMISRMLKKGLLARQRTKADARANAVRLTAKGRNAMNSVRAKVMKADAAVLKVIPKAQQAAFMRILKTISDQIDRELEEQSKTAKKRPAAKKKTAKRKTAKKKTAKRKAAKKKTARRR